MLRLTQAPDIATAMLWSDLLCEAGMPASVQRQHLGFGIVESKVGAAGAL